METIDQDMWVSELLGQQSGEVGESKESQAREPYQKKSCRELCLQASSAHSVVLPTRSNGAGVVTCPPGLITG